MKKLTYLLISLIITSCTTESVKEKINKSGDVAGQVVGEFATGVSNGVDKAINPKIEISETLKNIEISFGKMSISSDSLGNDNVLIAYVIFKSDLNTKITAKAFDSNNSEMGRVKIAIAGKKDDAKYYEFHFDKRTEIDNDSKIILE